MLTDEKRFITGCRFIRDWLMQFKNMQKGSCVGNDEEEDDQL